MLGWWEEVMVIQGREAGARLTSVSRLQVRPAETTVRADVPLTENGCDFVYLPVIRTSAQFSSSERLNA